MNILHITAHMGDGAGKAIGGLAALGSQAGEDTHRILLLDEPRKTNHIAQCVNAGIEILNRGQAEAALQKADVAVLSWWGGGVMDEFLRQFPPVPCRVALWSHKNGFYDPPLPASLVQACDKLLVTSPLTLEHPVFQNGTLVYGFGAFDPERIPAKKTYRLKGGAFTIGYVGMPSYKRLPQNALQYIKAVLAVAPGARFQMAGEASPAFQADVRSAGLSDKVSFLGWVDHVPDLLLSFDAFGYLLREDSSATTENSVLEAMAAGLPVVMSRRPVGRYIIPRNTGILIDTPEEYAAAARHLAESESHRMQLGTAARQLVTARYNAMDNVTRFRCACGEVMRMPKARHQFNQL